MVSLSLPLHFLYSQAHYLISPAALHYDRSLSELKANLQRHTASENCDEKVKSNNFLIWTQMLLVVRWNQPKAQKILLIIHHTNNTILHHYTLETHTVYAYCTFTHIHTHTFSHIETICLLSHRCSTVA